MLREGICEPSGGYSSRIKTESTTYKLVRGLSFESWQELKPHCWFFFVCYTFFLIRNKFAQTTSCTIGMNVFDRTL